MAESELDGASAEVTNPNHHCDSTAVDLISSLPDVILQHILSYNPTKFAIRTSLLSKRWKHVWRETPSISIDWYRDCRFRVDPSSILSSYSAPKITSFNLSNIDCVNFDSWIKLAISRNAENLRLMFCSKYSFQDFFFKNSSVKQLSVTLGFFDVTPKCVVSWTSLRSLSLNRCKLSDESIANILAGCPMLESLSLQLYDENFDHLDLSKSLRLTRLDIDFYYWDLEPMHIVAPHIHYLRLANSLQPCDLMDVSSLTEATLHFHTDCFQSPPRFGEASLLKVITKLQNIEKLNIGAVFLQILSLAELRGVQFPQLKIKTLVVETMIVRSVIPGLIRLLKNSPGLKKITILHIMKCNTILDEKLDIYLIAKGLNPDQCWINGFSSFSDNGIAKEAKLTHVASFMELVLRNTKALEKVVLSRPGQNIW